MQAGGGGRTELPKR